MGRDSNPNRDDSISESGASSGHRRHNQHDQKNEDPIIARAETRAVVSMRVVLLFVLISTTIGVTLAAYFMTSNAEEATFEEAFQSDADKVLASIGASLDNSLGAADAFVVSMVVAAKHLNNSSWPFFTMPSFAVTASKLRSLSNAFAVAHYPLVRSHQREEWANYSTTHDEWVNEAIDVQSRDDSFQAAAPENNEWQGWGEIFTRDGRVEREGPYFLPTWTTAPVVLTGHSPYNWDLYNSSGQLNRAITKLFESRHVILSETSSLPDPKNRPNDVESHKEFADWATRFVGEDQNGSEPFIPILYPVIDSLSDVSIRDPQSKPLVGVLAVSIFWRELMKDILPSSCFGIIVVIGNSCKQTMTYRIDGPSVTYIGSGDFHDIRYDGKHKYAKLLDLDAFSIRNKRSYTGLPLSEDYCPYWIRVYPSDELKDNVTSNNPAIFTVTAVLIFAFTSTIFVAYDCLVERRQRKMLRSAAQSSAIVSSLFPSTVQDRLMARRASAVMSREDDSTLVSNCQGEVDSEPIADLFPDTTVMFADVVGFTLWSSSRSPVEVFALLEAVYGAFDDVAMKLGVFKVETIGDSYMAASGLPIPCPDHAVVMTEFALECRDRTNLVVRQLRGSLGDDTGNLKMRFGLHSGAVTAGVLRGEKARFQLFGDTVNTASRMESTGEPNRIQISSTTATLLQEAGKGNLITAREDAVQVKGKGSMQTHWIK